MENLIQTILFASSICVLAVVYVFLIKNIIPRFLVKRRYFVDGNLGRGIKKYQSEKGRAVVYEPHPSIRKYVKQYAIVKSDGYKYLQCDMDSGVRRLVYSVIMFDCNDKILDVIEVEEITSRRPFTQTVYLHSDTSYIAFILNSVNMQELPNGAVSYYNLRDVSVFGGAVALLTFCLMPLTGALISRFLEITAGCVVNAELLLPSLFTAILAGVLSVVIFIRSCNKKNVRVMTKW